jgi:hypothetical protein
MMWMEATRGRTSSWNGVAVAPAAGTETRSTTKRTKAERPRMDVSR